MPLLRLKSYQLSPRHLSIIFFLLSVSSNLLLFLLSLSLSLQFCCVGFFSTFILLHCDLAQSTWLLSHFLMTIFAFPLPKKNTGASQAPCKSLFLFTLGRNRIQNDPDANLLCCRLMRVCYIRNTEISQCLQLIYFLILSANQGEKCNK